MFRNYLSAAVRNLLRNKLVSIINIAGLAVGFAAAILIALYIRYELSFDDSLPGERQVYRLSVTVKQPGAEPVIWDGGDFFMAEHLKLDYPEVQMTARVVGPFLSVRRGELEFHEAVTCVDPDFFRMLPFPAIAGDLAAALDSPDGLVLTRTLARKYFGDEDPLGQTLEFNRNATMRVRAVIEDLPGNSHFNFRIVVSTRSKSAGLDFLETLRGRPGMFVPGAPTYFRLRDGATIAHIKADAPNFIKRHYAEAIGTLSTLDIYPISQVHLSPPGRWPPSPMTNPDTLWTLGLVGLLIIFIAAINFVNLMTARAAQRSVEVGIRKSAGARRLDLIAQFLGEACIYVFVAMIVAMALVELALPAFNAMLSMNDEQYKEATVTFAYWREPSLAAALAVAALAVALLAGAYPAFVMSTMRPVNSLHRGAASRTAARIRQGLVVVQLSALIALIVATAVIHRQTAFAMNAALRIDSDQVVLLHFNQSTPSEAFKNALARTPGVSGVTAAAASPTNFDISAANFSRHGAEPVQLQIAGVDFNFFEFYQLKPLAGRLPLRERSTDRYEYGNPGRPVSVWVNESAVRALGISSPATAAGERIVASWPPENMAPTSITIAGVIPDFPVDSVRGRIQPVLYFVQPEFLRVVSVRLSGKQIPETLAAIDQVWKELGEPRAVARWFLDQYYHRMYIDIIQQRRVLGSLCGVAVFLACLGLFGLSIYTAQRRTKEIGIRKVMGAATSDVMRLLLWAFTKPVFWASLIAWPVAAWLMNRWLDGFVYRVDLGWWLLPAASLLALAITLATVSVHSFLVARAKPAGALRYE